MTLRELSERVSWLCVLEAVGIAPGPHGRIACPLHNGDNPTAFLCSEKTGHGHCFTCGWHGDKFDFLQAMLKISFKSALVRMAHLAGVRRVPPAGMLDVLHKRFLQQLLNWPHEGEALRELFPGRLRFSISDRIPASLRDTATCSRL